MADAKICDRCGEFYKQKYRHVVKETGENPSGVMKYYVDCVNGHDHIRTVDLCPDCYGSISNWLYRDK